MSLQSLNIIPQAIGEFIVLETNAIHPDKIEEVSAGGIIIKQDKPDFTLAIPRHATVISVGSEVPPILQVGDVVVFPDGGVAKNIEDPRIIEGKKINKEDKKQYCYVHWKNIGAKYQQDEQN